MPTASPEPKRPDNQLRPGEINLELIPAHWPLTPLKDKRAYVAGWTSQPCSIDRIRQELESGNATGVGLLKVVLFGLILMVLKQDQLLKN